MSISENKSYTSIIIELQDKNAELRMALGKLLQICKNCKMHEESIVWAQYIGIAQEVMNKTDINGNPKTP